VLLKAKKNGKPWALVEENRRLPLGCIGGPVFAISLFWLVKSQLLCVQQSLIILQGWTASPSIHWIVPMLAGLPFGIGLLLLWMALLNYLTDAYKNTAASALAASACTRSIFGAALPFAAKPMYDSLGVHWASSLLGFVSLGLAVVPFVFIRYGARLRARSKMAEVVNEKNPRDGS
jgi:hypothetical protein